MPYLPPRSIAVDTFPDAHVCPMFVWIFQWPSGSCKGVYGCKTHQINSPSSLILTHLFFIPLLLHPTSPSSNSSSSIFLIHLFLMDLPLCRRARQSPKEFSSLVFSLRPPSVSTTRPCPSCLCQFVPRALPTVVYILTAAWTSERLSTAATPSCHRLSSRQGESGVAAASSISSPVQ